MGYGLDAASDYGSPHRDRRRIGTLAAKSLIPATGREIDNVLPKTLHAKPYSVRGVVGRDGERWVPIHGMVSLTAAHATMSALDQYFAVHSAQLEVAAISIGYLFRASASMSAWSRCSTGAMRLSPLHYRHLSERNQVRFADRQDNFEFRASMAAMREDVRTIFRAHGALHAQLARFYPYLDVLDPGASTLARLVDFPRRR